MPPGLDIFTFNSALFDVDGTLVDSISVITSGLLDTFEHFFKVRPPVTEVRALIGLPLRSQFNHYNGGPVSEVEWGKMTSYAIQKFQAYKSQESEFESAIDTLRFLHRHGVKTALVISKNQSEIESFLPRFSARECVDTIVCASDVRYPKPAPDSAFLACERLGVSPDKAIMIGDSIFDMRCARDAGVFRVAVAYGAAPREELEAELPDLLIDQPEDLLAWAHQALLTHHAP